jgi:hypothetical protein
MGKGVLFCTGQSANSLALVVRPATEGDTLRPCQVEGGGAREPTFLSQLDAFAPGESPPLPRRIQLSELTGGLVVRGGNTLAPEFYKGRSQEKTLLQRLAVSLLRSPLD